jgi:hypothetical protein
MSRARAVAVLALLAFGAVAGCSDGTGGPVAAPTTVAPASPTPTDAAEPPDLPEQATSPPSTAGPVKQSNLPQPSSLGAGWKTYADPGGAEDGFLGNQTWTRRRDAHQAAFEALPVGCANQLPDTALPVPQYALQGAYRNPRGAPATVLVLRFAEPGQASTYFQGYGERMRACGRNTQGLSVEPLWSEPAAAGAIRRYAGEETFVEVAVLHGRSVALLANSAGDTRSDEAWSREAAGKLAAVVDR